MITRRTRARLPERLNRRILFVEVGPGRGRRSHRGRPGVRSPFAESPEFQRLLRRESRSDLVRITLEIARDAYPDLDLDHYLGKIEVLADRVRDRCAAGAKPRSVLGQINWVLYVEEGYLGNTE